MVMVQKDTQSSMFDRGRTEKFLCLLCSDIKIFNETILFMLLSFTNNFDRLWTRMIMYRDQDPGESRTYKSVG